jgi:hypothetical protein
MHPEGWSGIARTGALPASEASAGPKTASQGWRGTRHREAAAALTGWLRSGFLSTSRQLPRRP